MSSTAVGARACRFVPERPPRMLAACESAVSAGAQAQVVPSPGRTEFRTPREPLLTRRSRARNDRDLASPGGVASEGGNDDRHSYSVDPRVPSIRSGRSHRRRGSALPRRHRRIPCRGLRAALALGIELVVSRAPAPRSEHVMLSLCRPRAGFLVAVLAAVVLALSEGAHAGVVAKLRLR